MDTDDVKHWQAKKIDAALRPTLGYLFHLRERMQKKGFAPGDPYYQAVCRAYDAMHAVCVRTHYLTCHRVGRPDEEDEVAP